MLTAAADAAAMAATAEAARAAAAAERDAARDEERTAAARALEGALAARDKEHREQAERMMEKANKEKVARSLFRRLPSKHAERNISA